VKLEKFLQSIATGSFPSLSVVLFSAKEYPVVFFSAFLSHLRSHSSVEPKTVLFDQLSSQALSAQLSTTFLGRSDLLWVGDLSSLEPATLKKQMLSVVGSYQGPHTLMGCIHPDELSSSMKNVISLDEDFSPNLRRTIVTFLFPHSLSAVEGVEKLVKGMRITSIDQLIMLAQYAGVVGKNATLFSEQWMKKISAPESSLFDLSSYFFGRKTEQFWNAWHFLKDEYAAPFWTTYWSEQLWRAHYVIKLYKENKITEAKQLSFRLPFAFLQRDWKNISPTELQHAHQFLYEGDYAFKNGGSEFFLEVFYTTFLAKQF
jgi:hypothetical protein